LISPFYTLIFLHSPVWINSDELRTMEEMQGCISGWQVNLQHTHLKGRIFKMGLTNRPICERCLEKDESATHILCDCEATACLRFRHLGHYFTGPDDYQDTPVSKILHFIRSVGLLRGWKGEMHNSSLMVAVQGPVRAYPLLISFIHPWLYF
jgi:hypothetical protein